MGTQQERLLPGLCLSSVTKSITRGCSVLGLFRSQLSPKARNEAWFSLKAVWTLMRA